MNNCTNCQKPLEGSRLICAVCGTVQGSATMDYFQALGQERRFAIDTAALEREFHRLSRRLHPDRFARASADEQQNSLAATALLNDAWRTLRDPVARLEYLLKLEGYAVGEEHAGKGKSAERQPPSDLLEEVFELNMQLEELRMSQKMGEAADEAVVRDLAATGARFESMLQAVDDALAAEGAKWDTGAAEARREAATQMIQLLDRRRYLRNLVRDVRETLGAAA